MPGFEDLISHTGFLTDRQIQQAVEAGFLIEKGTWSADQLRHASYTLRLGGEIKVSRARDPASCATKTFTILNLTAADSIFEIHPGDTALLYCMERLRFPDSVLGFTVARGLLFAEALSPENTYVDPGFTGTIYTTVTNVSDRTVRLHYGIPIARLFFYRLSEQVKDGYRAGHAFGIAQQLESVPLAPVRTAEQCSRATDAQLLESIRLMPLGGLAAAEIIDRLNARHQTNRRQLFAFAVLWPPLLLVANNSSWVSNNLGPFAANVSASLVAAGLVYLTPKVWNFFSARDRT